MADSIKSRTLFYDNRNGHVRFHDWCVVDTTLGPMQEPRQLIGIRNGNKDNKSGQFNMKDQCAKITNLVPAELREIEVLLSDKKNVTISGTQIPVDFSY